MSENELERVRREARAPGLYSPLTNRFVMTDTGLAINQIAGEVTEDEWMEAGRNLAVLGNSYLWSVADWLNYGEHRFGERYVQAAELLGLKPKTLANVASVGRAYSPPDRLPPPVSFGHHEVVAWMNKDEKQRARRRELLERVRETRVSVHQFRIDVKAPSELPERRLYEKAFRDEGPIDEVSERLSKKIEARIVRWGISIDPESPIAVEVILKVEGA